MVVLVDFFLLFLLDVMGGRGDTGFRMDLECNLNVLMLD